MSTIKYDIIYNENKSVTVENLPDNYEEITTYFSPDNREIYRDIIGSYSDDEYDMSVDYCNLKKKYFKTGTEKIGYIYDVGGVGLLDVFLIENGKLIRLVEVIDVLEVEYDDDDTETDCKPIGFIRR